MQQKIEVPVNCYRNRFNKKGMTLIELLIGTVITGLVAWAGMSFVSSSQRTQAKVGLRNQMSSEIQEFFSNRRKSISKVVPSVGASLVTVTNASGSNLMTVTIPRTFYDSNVNSVTNNEIIEVTCADLPTGVSIADLPSGYLCSGTGAVVCNSGQVPIKVSIQRAGSTTSAEVYPNNIPDLEPFPTGAQGHQRAASLCPQKNGNVLSLKLSYLFRADTDKYFEMVTRTEVFELPLDNGVPKPRVLGNSP